MKIKKALAYILSAAMLIGMIPAVEMSDSPVKAAETLDVALYAAPESDHTASWENLNGINDSSFEPASSNVGTGFGWGNWDWNNTAGSSHYIIYRWNTAITTDTFQIYWYDDGGGTRVPATISFDYLDQDGSTWKSLTMVSGYNSIISLNRYNTVSVQSVTTKGIRMNMTIRDGAGGMGVYRWKVISEATEELTDMILSDAKNNLDIPEVKNGVLSSGLYNKLTLKESESTANNPVVISWTSSNTSVIAGNGTVYPPTEDKIVKLTATLSLNGSTIQKDFNILVLSKDKTGYDMTLNKNNKGVDISQELFGLFYEDINSAADGGLSPEMVKNNSFENYYDIATPDEVEHGNQDTWKWSWTSSNSNNFVVEQSAPLNSNNTNYAKITGNMTLSNNGFTEIYSTGTASIPITSGKQYDFSMFVKAASSYGGRVKVKIVNSSGTAITDEKEVSLIKNGTWQKISTVLTGRSTVKGKMVLSFENAGSSDVIYIDMVSLSPQDTYGYGNKNYAYGAGIRKDLVERLMALKPSFIRFPGGCVIEGDSGTNSFYNWENSVGPLEERKATANYWGKQEYYSRALDSLKYGYMMSYEFGYHEILTLCEDMGAEAFPILSAGIFCQFKNSAKAASGSELDRFAKLATDLLDYCWGDSQSSDPTQSYWAGKRVENGHVEPFDLHYMGIGNENWNDTSRGISYFDNFTYIKNIVDAYGRKNYPERYASFKLISSTGPYAEGTMMNDAWNWINSDMPGETLVDEHYYMGLTWMLNNTHRYDSYKRLSSGGSDVFVGEYAVNSSVNTLEAAIGEAAYMTGIERNADIVRHASYAPLLQKVGAANWSPNLIYFDEYDTMGTPNYYVQYMYSNNYGKTIVNTSLRKVNGANSSGTAVYSTLANTQKDIYQVSSMDDNYIYLKLVNYDSYDKDITLHYPGVANGATAQTICLTGSKDATNSIRNEVIVPVMSDMSVQNETLKYVVPAMSFTVVKVDYNGSGTNPTPTPTPTATPTVKPTSSPVPTATPTARPTPIDTPKPVATPEPTEVPPPTEVPETTEAPEATKEPGSAETSGSPATEKPVATAPSYAAGKPVVTMEPDRMGSLSGSLKDGDTAAVNGIKYRVTDASKKQAAAYGVVSKNRKTLKIPNTVTINGETVKVTSITAKAFTKMKKLNKVIIGSNIISIGSKAFYGDRKLRSIVIKSRKVKTVGKSAFKKISSKAKIKAAKKIAGLIK